MSECAPKVVEQGEVSKQQAEEILQRVKNLAIERAKNTGQPIGDAVKDVTQQLAAHDKFMAAMALREKILNAKAKTGIKSFVNRFANPGEGLLSLLEGGRSIVEGARRSIDYQMKALNNKYFGRLVAEMEEAGVLREFRTNSLSKEVYQEMGELKEGGKPGISGSLEAQKIAKILDENTKEMVARQNRAGAYIADLPGYVTRQSHSIQLIRAAGRTSDGTLSKSQSYQAWRDFTLPLLNKEQTFLGADPEKFMRNVHEGLYTGIHGPESGSGVQGWGVRGDIAKRASQSRVLHFADAESAWKYNQEFGIKDLRQQVLTDIHNRSRDISLMENLGPTPETTLTKAIREIKEESRGHDDAAQRIDSINDNKVMAAYRQLTGINSIPSNPTLARLSNNARALAMMSKLGSVIFTNLFSDRVFLQAEMAYQGISNMATLGKQLTSLARRSPEEKQMLRLMGVGMDSLMGNAMSRYGEYAGVGGALDKAQRTFFDSNFHNYWTDNTRSAAAELMSAHLGEHATSSHADLPPDTQRVLKLYDIGPKEWDHIRSTAKDGPNGGKFITPDQIQGLDQLTQREKDKLETSLRTYIQDRVDMAVPTPGGAERRIGQMDTKAGTPIGEAVRLMMIFKSFPLAVANKVLSREMYGRGATSAMDWVMNDHQGKFHMASLIAMSTVAGYLGLALRDAFNGKTPRELTTDGKINYDILNESAIRGGGMGLMGDFFMKDYGRQQSSFLEGIGGPVIGQADALAQIGTKLKHGDPAMHEIGKMTMDNTPLINLFYLRPILNYYVLWNLQSMMDPNQEQTMRRNAERNHQSYFMGPAAR